MPFANPIIGGGGALVYPAIHSPNFNMLTMTGWSIDKNGNAFFFGVVTSGTFQGAKFVFNSTGLFLYTGTPANGNLMISIVPGTTSVTDPFGNGAGPGITVVNPANGVFANMVNGTLNVGQFLTNFVTINNMGMFLYTADNLGGLIVALAQSAGTDAFGNAFNKGLGILDGTNTYAVDRSYINAGTNTVSNVVSPTWAALSDVLTIPANDAGAGTEYIIHVWIDGTTESGTVVNFGFNVSGTNTNLVPVVSGFTAGHSVSGYVEFHYQIKIAGASGTINVWAQGEYSDVSVNRSPSVTMSLNGFNTSLAFNTTISNTIQILANFGASVSGQVLVGHRTMFTRRGV